MSELDLDKIQKLKRREFGRIDFARSGPSPALEGAINRLIAEVERLREEEWNPGAWYRVVDPSGDVWCETTDPDEARREAEATGFILHRNWIRNPRYEWRAWDGDSDG